MTNQTNTIHKFELAGLGKAPFRFIGDYESRGPITNADGSQSGAPGQPMGTCDYCMQGIAICCRIESADGKRFIVGSDCVLKTGDAGLKRKVVKLKGRASKAREAKRIADMISQLEVDQDLRNLLMNTPTPPTYSGRHLLDTVEWFMAHAGHAGKIKMVRLVDKVRKC